MLSWAILLKNAALRSQMEAPLDLWARASFLEGWLQVNHLLPPNLKGFSHKSPPQISQGMAHLEQQFGEDTIHPYWTSPSNKGFYLGSVSRAQEYLQGFNAEFDAEEELLDLLQKSRLQFKEAGRHLGGLSLAWKGSPDRPLAWLQKVFLHEAHQFTTKFFRREKLLEKAPSRGGPPQWTPNELMNFLMGELFNDKGNQPQGAASRVIRVIKRVWETNLRHHQWLLLQTKLAHSSWSGRKITEHVTPLVGFPVTLRMYQRTKETWEALAQQTLAKNSALMEDLSNAIQKHLQTGAPRTSWRFASKAPLRGKIIRLAYRKPSLRNLLLPLL